MRLDVSDDARADLLDIREFGTRRWGRAQAASYAQDIRLRLRRLARGDSSGVAAEERGPGLRRLLARRHVIYFRIQGDRLRVVRILHQSQDPGRHLL